MSCKLIMVKKEVTNSLGMSVTGQKHAYLAKSEDETALSNGEGVMSNTTIHAQTSGEHWRGIRHYDQTVNNYYQTLNNYYQTLNIHYQTLNIYYQTVKIHYQNIQ